MATLGVTHLEDQQSLLRTLAVSCACLMFFMLVAFILAGRRPAVFNSSSGTAADNHTFTRNATERQYVRRDGVLLSPRESVDQPVGNASAASRGGRRGTRQQRVLARSKRTHHHYWNHHTQPSGGDVGPARQFDNMLFRTIGSLDANMCVSKFVCELVARRGARSFIGTTLGDIFKGLSRAPYGSPAHSLWRAAAIGKHGWLPVCSSAYPECSSGFSTFLSIANVIG